MKQKYQILADYLSDHLWQRNSLDYDFLKLFPEFVYKGKAYEDTTQAFIDEEVIAFSHSPLIKIDFE